MPGRFQRMDVDGRGRIATAISELRNMIVYEVDGKGNRSQLYEVGDPMSSAHMDMDAARLDDFLSILSGSLPNLRVLDVGANPYILTYALARLGVSVVASGFPLSDGAETTGQEFVQFAKPDGETVSNVPLARFNVELDPFPFEDGSFDVVVCGEIIEHLPNGPDQMLQECNRVLVPGGRLLLSTPNSVSLTRLLAIARGVNPDWPFSTQGIYGRHNRNYTQDELRDLLVGNGFRPFLEKGLTYFHQRGWYSRGPFGAAKWSLVVTVQRILTRQPYRLRRWAEGLLVAATKVGPPRRYRPPWLFGAADTVPMIAPAKREAEGLEGGGRDG